MLFRHSHCISVALLASVMIHFAGSGGNALAQEPDTEPDPVVEQLLLKSSGGPKAMGVSVSMLARIGEFEAVSGLLEQVADQNSSPADLVMIASEIDPRQRLRIFQRPEVTEKAKAALESAFVARRTQNRSPDRLAQAVKDLLVASPDVQLRGIRALFQGEDASIVALVDAIVQTNLDDRSRRDQLLKALVRIDRQAGADALVQLSLYGAPEIRLAALAGLSRLGSDEFLATWLASLHEQHFAPEEEGQSRDAAALAAAVLRRDGMTLPDRDRSVNELRKRLTESMRVAIQSTRIPGRQPLWLVNPERSSVTQATATPLQMAYRIAADDAARLTRVGDDDPTSLADQLNATLAYQVINDPDWGDDVQIQNIIAPFAPSENDTSANAPQWLSVALQRAAVSDNDAAVIGLLRVIGATTEVDQSGYWLRSEWTPSWFEGVSPLVELVDHPNPLVRYEAAAMIAQWQPTMSFAGSNRVLDRLRQMTSLNQMPTAVVLETRPDVIADWERVYSQAGYDPIVVSSLRELERVVSIGGDLRLIAVKREPVDASAIEVIDVVRRVSVGRDIPILVYDDPLPLPPREVPAPELTAEQIEDKAYMPDDLGVIGGIETIEGIVERDFLAGDLDFDRTTRPVVDVQTLGIQRWRDESLRAGLIRVAPRPRSSLGLYEFLLDSRTRMHLPPPSVVDRSRFARIAKSAIASQATATSAATNDPLSGPPR